MIPKQLTTHRVQLVLHVTDIHIEIRFPCMLQVGIKIGKEQFCGKEEVELKSGMASFTESLITDILITHDSASRRYVEKKATVTVYVVSPRGRNVAGVLPIDLSSVLNRPTQDELLTKQKLQRCPDKMATISLRLKGTVLQKFQHESASLNSDKSENCVPSNNRETSSSKPPRLYTEMASESSKNSNYHSLSSTQKNTNQTNNKRSVVEEVGSPISIKITKDEFKVRKDDSLMINENHKLKSRVDQLQRQVESLKRDVAEKKRLQKEQEALNFKVAQLQRVVNSNRVELDNAGKEKRRETGQLSNRLEQLEKINASLQKRVDVKANFYKEELEKFNAKLLVTQNQKQQLIVETFNLKDENFDLSRKLASLKDKEKLLAEDKIKLTKKIEEMKKQHSERELQVEQSSKDIMHERLKQTISNNELEKLSLLDQVEKLKSQVQTDSIYKAKYQQELKDKNNVIQQRMSLENQHQLKEQDSRNLIAKLNKSISQRVEEIGVLNGKLLQLGNKHKSETQVMIGQFRTLKSTLDFVKETEEKGRFQYQEVSFNLQECQRQLSQSSMRGISLESALKESKNEIQQLRRSLKVSTEEEKALKSELHNLKGVVSQFQSQLTLETQSKRNNQKQYKQVIERLEATNKQSQKELLLLHEQLQILKSQSASQQIDNSDQLDRKDRAIREKEQELRNIYQQQTDLQMANAQLQSRVTELREVLRVTEIELNKQKAQHENLRKMNSNLQEEESQLKSSLNNLTFNFEQKSSQCQALMEAKKSLEVMLNVGRKEQEKFKEQIGEHLNTLLKCLLTKGKTEGPVAVTGFSEGLLKLESDVISKVRACYDQLQTTTQKLTSMQMGIIHLEQGSNLQVQTLNIELDQLRRQLQTVKDDKTSLGSDLENAKNNMQAQNENLRRQMRQLEHQLSEKLSSKVKEGNDRYQKDSLRWKEESGKQKEQYQNKIAQLESQITNIQKELYDTYNQVNVMSLKNYENVETVKELESRLTDNNSKEHLFENDRTRLVNNIIYLEQELNGLTEFNDLANKNLTLALERETILQQENEYMRSHFKVAKAQSSGTNQFQQRQKNVVETHRITMENGKLLQMVQQLQLTLGEKESIIKTLEQSVRMAVYDVQEKYKNMYSNQGGPGSFKSQVEEPISSRDNLSKSSISGQHQLSTFQRTNFEAKLRIILDITSQLLPVLSEELQLRLRIVYDEVQGLLSAISSKEQHVTVRPMISSL